MSAFESIACLPAEPPVPARRLEHSETVDSAELEASLVDMDCGIPKHWSETGKRLFRTLLLVAAPLLGGVAGDKPISPHDPISLQKRADAVAVQALAHTPDQPSNEHKPERTLRLPEIQGLRENTGIRPEHLQRFLQALPSGLIDLANTRNVSFESHTVTDSHGPSQAHESTTSAARPATPDEQNTTLGRHVWDQFSQTSEDERTDTVRIAAAYHLLGVHDPSRFNQLDFRSHDPSLYSVHEMTTTLVHELVHGFSEKNKRIFEDFLRAGKRLRFDYTEGIIHETRGNTSAIDWPRLIDEYRSEFIGIMLSKVNVLPGQSFRSAAIGYFVQHHNEGQLSEEEIGEQVDLVMGLLAGTNFNWEGMRQEMSQATQQMQADYLLFRFDQGAVRRVTDEGLRTHLSNLLVSSPEESSPTEQRLAEYRTRPTPEGQAYSQRILMQRTEQRNRLEARLPLDFSHAPQAVMAYTSWREVVQTTSNIKYQVHDGFRLTLDGLTTEAMDQFTHDWNVLDEVTQARLRPYLQRVVAIEGGNFDHEAASPHGRLSVRQGTAHHGHRSHHRV